MYTSFRKPISRANYASTLKGHIVILTATDPVSVWLVARVEVIGFTVKDIRQSGAIDATLDGGAQRIGATPWPGRWDQRRWKIGIYDLCAVQYHSD